MSSCTSADLECAPCPPPFIPNVYEVLKDAVDETGLGNEDFEYILLKCNIEKPTTTTSTTTTTTTPPPTTTTTITTTTTALATTTEEEIQTTTKITAATTTEEKNVTDILAPNITVPTTALSTSIESSTFSANISSTTTETNSSIFTNISASTRSSSSSTDAQTTTVGPIVTQGSLAAATFCDDKCILGLTMASVSLFFILLVALGILFRKERESRKRGDRIRRQNIPSTDLYDSVEIQDKGFLRSESPRLAMFRHSGDFAQSFDNPAYRRSFELRTSRFGDWYDPDAANYEYSQTMANLTRKHSPERHSLPRTPISDRRVEAPPTKTKISEYVPRSIKHSKDYIENNPYSSPNTHIAGNLRNKVVGNGGLPRTLIDNDDSRKNIRESSHRRSRSHEPVVFHKEHPAFNNQMFHSVERKGRSKKTQSTGHGKSPSRKERGSDKSHKYNGRSKELEMVNWNPSVNNGRPYSYKRMENDGPVQTAGLQVGSHAYQGHSKSLSRNGNNYSVLYTRGRNRSFDDDQDVRLSDRGRERSRDYQRNWTSPEREGNIHYYRGHAPREQLYIFQTKL